ncbi:type II toxin-antitoxin system RelE/ParE family toxin [Neorhizobium lilium]|uniref:Toxin n=1 Tax=Neorhizobium lilium TaxID=2503024 RepID=A0A3S3RGK2_9HYPH|nr:type II toxin-antitoxin system RelE/ParE family toxin [Neorhizobium lilium]RWX77272.1 type II toxin-antitoxin system RelE/ParE family toxin [Neorhizobium lilium]
MPAERTFRLSPLAEADLEDIWSYTADRWSIEQAEHYHGMLLKVLGQLAEGSSTGRHVDVRRGYLKYRVGSHVIFFRSHDVGIDVVRILHQRMDVSLHLVDDT